MADYVLVRKSSKGTLAISRPIFEKIATNATNEVIGARVTKKVNIKNKTIDKVLNTASWFKPVRVSFKKNGDVDVNIAISLAKGANADQVSLAIQEKVSNALLAYTENVPFKINIQIIEIQK